MGPALVIALVGQSVIKALARNPSAASKIFMGLVILLLFVESIAVVALLVIFQLFSN
jgi:F0F1-type ATP synthase membrane subunit c/vacuolar-type H+-ATPase subunit K